jgi:hypothetical protein
MNWNFAIDNRDIDNVDFKDNDIKKLQSIWICYKISEIPYTL